MPFKLLILKSCSLWQHQQLMVGWSQAKGMMVWMARAALVVLAALAPGMAARVLAAAHTRAAARVAAATVEQSLCAQVAR